MRVDLNCFPEKEIFVQSWYQSIQLVLFGYYIAAFKINNREKNPHLLQLEKWTFLINKFISAITDVSKKKTV